MKELTERFNSTTDIDDTLEEKRKEDQLTALKKITEEDSSYFNYKEVEKKVYLSAKAEIKKYEKELELKATQNEAGGEVNSNPKDIISNTNFKSSGSIDFGVINNPVEDEYKLEEDKNIQKIKISDFFNLKDGDKHASAIQQIKTDAYENLLGKKKEREETEKEYKSEILNDFNNKLKKFGKLSKFDIHILLYVFHTLTNELIAAKNSKKDYVGDIDPLELMKFLKEYKQITEK